MIATLNRRSLLDALELARKWVAPTKDSPPICSTVLLRTAGDVVELVRSDLDREVLIRLDAAIGRHGEAIVSANALYRIAKTSRATALGLSLGAVNPSHPTPALTIDAGPATYDLVGTVTEGGFPEAGGAAVRGSLASRLPASTLRWLVGATVYAVGAANDSPTDCLELTFGAGTIRALATDGHRAAISDLVHGDAGAREEPIYLPGDTAARLLALKAECMVGLTLRERGRLSINLGSGTFLSCRAVDRAYPDVESVVRRLDVAGEVVAQREQLVAALDRASAVLDGSPVRLSACDEQLTVSGSTPEGARIVEHFPARADGTERQVYVNPSFATDALRALTSSEVSLRIGAEALVVRPVLQDDMTQRQLAVVMPCKEPEASAAKPQAGRLERTVDAIATELAKHPAGASVESVTVTVPGEGSVTVNGKTAEKKRSQKKVEVTR